MWKTALIASQKASISASHPLRVSSFGDTASKGTGHKVSAGLSTMNLKPEIRPTARMLGPVWKDQRPIPSDPPSTVAVRCLTILDPPGLSNCLQRFSITAFPIPQSFSDLAVPKTKFVFHGRQHRLSVVMRLSNDLYFDAEVVEVHIVFDDWDSGNGSAGDLSTKISKGKAIIILQYVKFCLIP